MAEEVQGQGAITQGGQSGCCMNSTVEWPQFRHHERDIGKISQCGFEGKDLKDDFSTYPYSELFTLMTTPQVAHPREISSMAIAYDMVSIPAPPFSTS